ncbi:MAG: DegT/DnrJ/EryC1/StrS family aminotransferase [Candidatus Thorarchaeota archaeon]
MIPHSKPTITQHDIEAVAKVLQSGMIAQGEKVAEFENRLASFIGKKYAIACSSGTSALHLALLSLDIRVNDEVILPSYVCSSPYLACTYVGANSQIADIDPLDFNISSESVKNLKSSRCKAVIVPHLFGTPAELDEFMDEGIPIVEDCAQSIGAIYRGRKVGTFGAFSIFSFYATKMITTGEGGMLLTDDVELYERAQELRDYDQKSLTPVRYNYKMTDFQAALGISQLSQIESFIERRQEIASLYTERLSNSKVKLPRISSHKKSVFYRYVIMIRELEKRRNALLKMGITCERPVFLPLHRSVAGCKCPQSDEVYAHALSIPLYPALSSEEVMYVMDCLCKVLEGTDK